MSLLVIAPQVLAKRSTTSPAAPTSTTCTGTLAHATATDITVPSGTVCRLSGSTVNGSVTVQQDAYFEAWDTKVNGAVRATSALTIFLHDRTSVSGSVLVDQTAQVFLYKTTVGGTVRVTRAVGPGFGHVQVCETEAGAIDVSGSGPDVLIGDPQGGCAGNLVGRDMFIGGNSAGSELEVSGNVVAGSLVVADNTGRAPKEVTDNIVQGAIELSNNAAPFASANNGPEG